MNPHERGYTHTRMSIPLLSDQEVAALVAGIDRLLARTLRSMTIPSYQRVAKDLKGAKERLGKQDQGPCLFEVDEHVAVAMAAEMHFHAEANLVSLSALRQVRAAKPVVQGEGPPLKRLLKAAESLDSIEGTGESEAFELSPFRGADDTGTGEPYTQDLQGHRTLLTDAARYLHEGQTVGVRQSWPTESRSGQVTVLTVESLQCDCGMGLLCALTIDVREPSLAKRRQEQELVGRA